LTEKQQLYFERYAVNIDAPQIPGPAPDLGISVVMPAFKEKHIEESINSLLQCALPLGKSVELIIVLNFPSNANDEIKQFTYGQSEYLTATYSKPAMPFPIHIIEAFDLPWKKAGVGLARKIGMDLAAKRLLSLHQHGILCCFDADSKCDPNYLEEVNSYFSLPSQPIGASIYFEHPISGQNDPIVQYELHLRYLINALRYSQFPYAYHTVGSSMAVRADAYVKYGGMNTKKAGEDFYFINKFIPNGYYKDLTTTRTIPSSRQSDRVPFGTGRAMLEINTKQTELKTYHFQSYRELKQLFSNIDLLYGQNGAKGLQDSISHYPSIYNFLVENDFINEHNRILSGCSNPITFKKAFFAWFDAFKVIKYLHYSRDNFYPNVPISQAIEVLFTAIGLHCPPTLTDKLTMLRNYDKNTIYK